MKKFAGMYVVLVLFILPLLSGCGGNSSSTASYPSEYKTTVLIYMVGSNLESDDNLGTKNIEEMTAVGSTEDVKIVVTTGGAEKDGWRTVKRHEILKGAAITVADMGSVSMGAPETLTDFIVWGMSAYPADKYVLILWDHGGGAIGGFGFDDVHNNEHLSLPKLAQALADAYETTNRTFELIGFDACLMANTETAFNIRPYGHYLAASEELEPGEGWDYTGIFQYLTENADSADGAALGKIIADTFKEKIDTAYNGMAALTFSITDLNRISPLFQAAIEVFADRIRECVSSGSDGWIDVAKARSDAYDFATSRIQGSFYDMVDLKDFALTMQPLAPTESALVQAAVDYAVIYKVHTLRPDAFGLTIYFPTGSIRNENYYTAYQTIDFPDTYKSMISAYIAKGIQDVSPPVFSGENKTGNLFTAMVAGDDMESVSAFISKTDADGDMVMLGLTPALLEDDGTTSMEWTGTWLSLNGVTVSAFVEVPGDTTETLSIPVKAEGDEALLIVTHDKTTGTMTINGVWPGLNATNYMAERLEPLEAGLRIAPGFQTYNPGTGKVTIKFGDEYILTEPITLAATPLPAGNYNVAFYALDLAYNYAWSSTATFTSGETDQLLSLVGQPTKIDPGFAAAVSDTIRWYRGR